MKFDEQVASLDYSLVDREASSWVAQRPQGRSTTGETGVNTMGLEEFEELAAFLDEPEQNVIATPCWMVTVEVPDRTTPVDWRSTRGGLCIVS